MKNVYRVIVEVNNQVVYFSADQRTCNFGENLVSHVFLQVADQTHYKNIKIFDKNKI